MSHITTQVAIVGGGISGLALGFNLRQRGVETCVLEMQARPGGNIRSEQRDGFLCEWGPNGFLDNEPAMLRLIEQLGLSAELVAASASARKRWVVRAGRLRALPLQPVQFLLGDALSLPGKLRLLLEWAQRAPRELADESVYDFAVRRVGRQAAEVLVDAMVTGVYAGDSQKLSLPSTFPRMREMERTYGSLFRALRVRRRERRNHAQPGNAQHDRPPGAAPPGPMGPGGTLHSFAPGMERLVHALRERLGAALHLGSTIASIRHDSSTWKLQLAAGQTCSAEHLVMAAPAWAAAPLLHDISPPLALELAAIPSAPVAVVCLGFRARDVERVAPGFGFLVPRCESIPILGVLFDSWLFPNRCDADHVLFRALVGGARDLTAVQEPDAALVGRTQNAIQALLHVDAAPVMAYVVRHRRGIPQYVIGHAARLQRLATHLAQHPRLHVAGYSYHGIAMNACVKEAETLATTLAAAE